MAATTTTTNNIPTANNSITHNTNKAIKVIKNIRSSKTSRSSRSVRNSKTVSTVNDYSVSPTLIFKSSAEPLLSYLVFNIDGMVECSKERIYYQHMLLPDLPNFIKLIYRKCHITPTVLVIGLIYLQRVKKNLPEQAQGEYDTPYKLFLAAMIVATKYIEDNTRYAVSFYKVVSPLYTSKEINEMERSFLGVLKFNLYVDITEMDQFVEEHQESLELELSRIV